LKHMADGCWLSLPSTHLLSVARNASISLAILQQSAERLCEAEHLVLISLPSALADVSASVASLKNHV